MDNLNRTAKVFKERVRVYFHDRANCSINRYGSPIFDLLNTAARFGLLQRVCDMTLGAGGIFAKTQWSRTVWSKGWELDDLFWKSATMVYISNDLLRNTVGKAQYLTWWHLADNTPRLQKMCETMARLVCHTSLLKDDDPRCKGGSNSMKNCPECDLSIPETVKHLVMQCPANEGASKFMFDEIQKVDNNFVNRCANDTDQVFFWLLGKHIEGVDVELMANIWIIAGYHISKMYMERIHSRENSV